MKGGFSSSPHTLPFFPNTMRNHRGEEPTCWKAVTSTNPPSPSACNGWASLPLSTLPSAMFLYLPLSKRAEARRGSGRRKKEAGRRRKEGEAGKKKEERKERKEGGRRETLPPLTLPLSLNYRKLPL